MKKILLIDVDSKIPNLALMKLSTYYKSKGYEIVLKKLNFNYYKEQKNRILIDGTDFNKIYVSVIFPNNKDVLNIVGCNDIDIGGTGFSLSKKLPKEIDDCEEDYSIYPENDISYGFITRGCIRNCYFCFVPEKEGYLYKYRDINQIVKHKKVKFMDNNILAYDKANEILQELIDKKLKCEFNQALDIRLLDDKKCELLSKINYIGEYTFSFDNLKDENLIKEKLELFKKYVPRDWGVKMFLYCNNSMPISDIVYRIEWCNKNKVFPYVMRDKEIFTSEFNQFYVDISAWCNQPNIFKKMTFGQFIIRRHPKNKARVERSLELWEKT